jgi:glycosyltransferase involved in cell wall biosynthesis
VLTECPRTLSVVVPLFDEGPNVDPLLDGILAAVRPLGLPFEVIAVDDGSRDDTLARLHARVAGTPELVVVALQRNFGQTLALAAGLDRSRGAAVVTLDGDLQNDPADIGALLAELSRGADVVSGWRRDRRDSLLRTLPSRVANRLIRAFTGVEIHDQGCALKAYRGDLIRAVRLYGDQHRFVATLLLPLGARIAELPVRHHPRVAGRSKYGLSRTLRVLADLFTLQMLTRFQDRPLRWFAALGLPFLVVAVVCAAGALATPGSLVVLTTLAFLATSVFGSCVLLGVLGEAVLEEAGARRNRPVLVHEWRASS